MCIISLWLRFPFFGKKESMNMTVIFFIRREERLFPGQLDTSWGPGPRPPFHGLPLGQEAEYDYEFPLAGEREVATRQDTIEIERLLVPNRYTGIVVGEHCCRIIFY